MTIEGHESSNMYSMYSNLNCWTVVEICVCQLNKTPYTEDWKFQFIPISLKKKTAVCDFVIQHRACCWFVRIAWKIKFENCHHFMFI